MAAKKFVRLVSGRLKEIAGIVTSAGAGNDGDIPALDAAGKLDASMMPNGFGADTKTLVASEALSAGDLISLWNDSGTEKMRKADATAEGKEANGFVLGAVSNGASGTAYMDGTVSGLSSLTLAARYYLDTTAGGITTTPPSGSGNVVQFVGTSLSATELSFEPGEPVTVA